MKQIGWNQKICGHQWKCVTTDEDYRCVACGVWEAEWLAYKRERDYETEQPISARAFSGLIGLPDGHSWSDNKSSLKYFEEWLMSFYQWCHDRKPPQRKREALTIR